jgi:hypothetical protein
MMPTATAAIMTVDERPPEGEEAAVELLVLDCVDRLVMIELADVVDVVGANTWKHSSAARVEFEARKLDVSGA